MSFMVKIGITLLSQINELYINIPLGYLTPLEMEVNLRGIINIAA